MRKILLAAVASAAIATPAFAHDGAPYVGFDLGVMKPQDSKLNTSVDFGGTIGTRSFADGMVVNYRTGYDADINAGYDFGLFRAEAELGYKHARISGTRLGAALLGNLTDATDSTTPITNDNFSLTNHDHVTVLSGMLNAMLDFGDDQLSGFAGGGVGVARVHLLGDSASKFAWQGFAGVRYGISENLDLSLKYRYFQTGFMNFHNDFDFGADGVFPFSGRGRYRSNSLLLGLTYNFAAPPPPPPPPPPPAPPPPPPPPATQTCPDGSVILATDTCPAPPPPPPPPPPAPERGQ
jgi:OmpA-OmpF porin, OOP family